jgi:transcriptional regulator with XRE-family HTH domain
MRGAAVRGAMPGVLVAMTERESNLRKRRKEAGISLREMARRCCISPAYLSDIERGRRSVSSGTFHDITAQYNMAEAKAFDIVASRVIFIARFDE